MAKRKNALLYFAPSKSSAPGMEERQEWIREVAYYKAMNRRFTPGHELMDWLAAEQEVDQLCRQLSDD
jgi:hypothetical protein